MKYNYYGYKFIKRKIEYYIFLFNLSKKSKKILSFHTSQLTELYCRVEKNNISIRNNLSFKYKKLLKEDILGIESNSLASMHLNNAGNPYIRSYVWKSETKSFEIKLLSMWEKFLGLEKNQMSGYVTSGSTEGNMACINWHILFLKKNTKKILYIKSIELKKKSKI